MASRFGNDSRTRKMHTITLDEAEREALEILADRRKKTKSRVIGDLIMVACYGHRAFASKRRRKVA